MCWAHFINVLQQYNPDNLSQDFYCQQIISRAKFIELILRESQITEQRVPLLPSARYYGMTYFDVISRAVTQLNPTAATGRHHIRERVNVIVGCDVSARTIQRVLLRLNLTRGQLYHPSDAELLEAIREQQRNTAELVGAHLMHIKIRQLHPNWHFTRERVRVVLRQLNPAAVVFRREIHVHPRIYRSRGPDDTWHLDQHDKLKSYGFPLHACIDGYSRKILWLLVVPSNNNPVIITDIYLQCVKALHGCPLVTRSDYGTENFRVAAAQRMFASYQVPVGDNSWIEAHRFGSSTSNSRIESTWSRLRRHGGHYWLDAFDVLQQQGWIQLATDEHQANAWMMHIFNRIVLPLLSAWLDLHKRTWNNHYIRRSHSSSVPGHPNRLYSAPYQPAVHCMQTVTDDQVDSARRATCNDHELQSAMRWMTWEEEERADQCIRQYMNNANIQTITMGNWTEVYCGVIHQERERIIREINEEREEIRSPKRRRI